jgi:hypothetical protein
VTRPPSPRRPHCADALGSDHQREGAPAAELRLGTPYLRAVEQGGGLPVVLAPDDPAQVEQLLDRLDGLCLAGSRRAPADGGRVAASGSDPGGLGSGGRLLRRSRDPAPGTPPLAR